MSDSDSDSQTDITHLTEPQQESLQQFIAVTGQELDEAIPLLRRSEWNVQIAISKFFDGEAAIPEPVASDAYIPPPQQARRQENLMRNLSTSSASSRRSSVDVAPRIVPQSNSQRSFRPPLLFRIVFAPVRLVFSFGAFLFRPVFYLFPFLSWVLPGLGPTRPVRRLLGPQEAAVNVKRQLKADYDTRGFPFLEEGYAQAQDRAKKDVKFLLVILYSPEHDHTDAFLRETLFSDEVVSYLKDKTNNTISWVGDVQEPEAYQVAASLDCTKFPSSALLSLVPQSSTTKLRVVSRISGPCTASSYTAHLQASMGSYSEALETVRSTRAAQSAERNYREEQNAAYERSLEIDRERVRLRREAEESERALEKASEEEAQSHAKRVVQKRQWRRWRASNLLPEPAQGEKEVVRVSVRTPWGERLVRRFDVHACMEEVYAFVDCKRTMDEQEKEEKGSEKPAEKPEGYKHEFGFVLVSPLPRMVYEADEAVTIKAKVGRAGNLIVEALDDDEEWMIT
ncbi:MAG: hypothetical protein M1814_006475 [Vezdaea aestivalis]|nr:MAG: hypothetical protein M1814_006475 [Vezdaea aestivalis]